MTAVTHALNAALVHSLWEDAAIAMALMATLSVLRQHSPTARYAASCLALALMAVLPVLTATAPDLGLATRESPLVSGVLARFVGADSNPVAAIDSTSSTSAAARQSGWSVSVQPWALPCWFAGVLLFSVRLLSGALRTVTLKHRASPADEGLRAMVDRLRGRLGITRRVDLLTGVNSDGPGAFGWLRPVILLPPATLMGLTPQQLEAVLAHELAHIRRHDYLVNVLQLVIETVFFYHPAIWWASGRIRLEREWCCDDIAVKTTGNALGYARALTTLADTISRRPSLAVGATDGPSVYRIKRLLGVTAHEPHASWVAVLAVALVVTCGILNVDGRLAAPRSTASAAGFAPGATFEVASIKLNNGPLAGGILTAGCRGIDSRQDGALGLFVSQGTRALVPLGRCVIIAQRLDGLMSLGFGMPVQRISGFPAWARDSRFNIEAKAEDPARTTEQQLRSMLRQFLIDQFSLTMHRDTKDGPTWSLVVAKNGPKNLHPSEAVGESMMPQGTKLVFKDYSMQNLADFFSMLPTVQSRPVKDMTALTGRFDFSLDISGSTPKDLGAGDLSSVSPEARRLMEWKMAMAGWDNIFSDVQQQLGLRLEPSRGPIEYLIMDHAELPRTPGSFGR
jgi:uncharacterized protein (TIGR03435 family)